MISIIICSQKERLDSWLIENITQTIGVKFEVIPVNNSRGVYSIFEAYNAGAAKASNSIVCFMHEDILYHSKDWGKKVVSLLQNETIGIMGVAGSTLKSEIPSPWWVSNFEFYEPCMRYSIVQHSESKKILQQEYKSSVRQSNYEEVLILDGVWLCCKKEVWAKVLFDEQSFKGFHFYDIDFSFSVWKKGYKNIVCYDILIEHFSSGTLNKQWVDAAFIFHKKWEKYLPVSLNDEDKPMFKHIRKLAIKNFLNTLIHTRYRNFFQWIKYWLQGMLMTPFKKEYYALMYHYLKMFLN